MAFQAALNFPHRFLAQRYSFLIHLTAQRHYRMDALPGHTFGPFQHRLHIDQLRPIPVHLQNAPAPLNRIIFAVVGRVIQSLNGLANVVRKLHHAMQKLRTHTTAFRPIVHFDLSQLYSALGLRVHCLPLGFERINEKITGFVGTPKGNAQLPALFIHDAARDILLPTPEVVVTGFVIAPGHPTARKLPNVHRRFTIDAQALDPSRCRGVGILFLMLSKIASVSLIFFCGLALTTLRRRKPMRFSTAAIVEGAGSWSSL